jgi:dimethylglycine dehydrogenase
MFDGCENWLHAGWVIALIIAALQTLISLSPPPPPSLSLSLSPRHPLINVSNIQCGLYTPNDGYVDPTMLTNAVAKEARNAGAVIRFNAKATSVIRDSAGRFVVMIDDGEALEPADFCVNAAGLWSRNVTSMAEITMAHPAFVIEHQYAVTEPLPALLERTSPLPVLRDLAGSSYIRQEQKGLLVGPYENEVKIRTEWPNGPPDTWGMELFPDALDRIMPNIEAAMELVPSLETVGIRSIVNGPTIWTGDSLPRVGRTAVPGWFDFNSLTYGIAQSLALAEYLGHLMLTGAQPFDATDYFDPLRYSEKHSIIFAHEKICETYAHNNAITYPHEHRPAGLVHITQSPVIARCVADGAQLGTPGAGGITAPLLFSSNASSGSGSLHNCRQFSHFGWAHTVQHEADTVLEEVGVSYSSFSNLSVTGSDALTLIKETTTGVIPSKLMTCRLSYALTNAGAVHSEYTVCRRSANDFYVVGSRDHAAVDVEWFRTQARRLGLNDVIVQDKSDAIDVLHIAGPDSRTLLTTIDDTAADVPFFQSIDVPNFGGLGIDVVVCRMSFTGCAGYELHVPAHGAPTLWGALTASNPLRFGGLAVNALRIEKGYQVRADFDYAHYTECDIDAFVSKKRTFLGKDTTSDRNMTSVLLAVGADSGWEWSLLSDSPIICQTSGSVVGYTTTSACGARSRGAVTRGFLDRGVDPENCVLEAYGNRWALETFVPQ